MKEGEIVKYDFEVYADDELIDTTVQDLAKEHDIEVEDGLYSPRYAIIGMDGAYPGIKDALLQAEDGGDAEFEVSAKDAFGERNPRNLDYRRYSDIAMIANKQEKEVNRGVKLDIDGRVAMITLVTPARVRIDFNHELAGKVIKSKVSIKETLTEQDAIIRAILEMNVGSSDDFDIIVDDDILSITIPSAISLGYEWSALKLRVVTQLRKQTGIKNIRYIEEFFQKAEVAADADAETETEITVGTGDVAPEDPASEVPETADEPASEEPPVDEIAPEDPSSEAGVLETKEE
jgi:FKBP-type peptidyl-prolyl cis-trans isomerase 2